MNFDPDIFTVTPTATHPPIATQPDTHADSHNDTYTQELNIWTTPTSTWETVTEGRVIYQPVRPAWYQEVIGKLAPDMDAMLAAYPNAIRLFNTFGFTPRVREHSLSVGRIAYKIVKLYNAGTFDDIHEPVTGYPHKLLDPDIAF